MTLVDSEAIAEIRYDAERSTMLVRFVDGEWYSYFNVPAGVYKAFVAAEFARPFLPRPHSRQVPVPSRSLARLNLRSPARPTRAPSPRH